MTQFKQTDYVIHIDESRVQHLFSYREVEKGSHAQNHPRKKHKENQVKAEMGQTLSSYQRTLMAICKYYRKGNST